MVSITIPCYNASATIKKCVRSVLRQSYTDIEVIVVDDCSSDDSVSVCHRLVKEDNRVRLIEAKENKGVDRARFTGLAAAKGDFIMFVDSDDWISGKHTLAKMVEEHQKHNADYVQIGMRRVLDKMGLIRGTRDIQKSEVIENPHLFEDYYISFFGVNKLSVSMCGKLYRRSSIDKANIQPSGLKMGEDLHFNLMLFPHIERIVLLDIAGYNYQFGGMTSKYNTNLFDNLYKLYNIKKALIEKYRYTKASDFIIIEIVNVLRSEICQDIRYNSNPNATKQHIADLLKLEVWSDIDKVSNHDQWLAKPFTQAVKTHDVTKIYDICAEIERKNRKSLLLKRSVSKLLSII